MFVNNTELVALTGITYMKGESRLPREDEVKYFHDDMSCTSAGLSWSSHDESAGSYSPSNDGTDNSKSPNHGENLT